MNNSQSRTTQENLNEINKTVLSLSKTTENSEDQEYQSINNLQRTTVEDTNDENKHFRSTIFIHIDPNGINNS